VEEIWSSKDLMTEADHNCRVKKEFAADEAGCPGNREEPARSDDPEGMSDRNREQIGWRPSRRD
jgi:hypothetical protein